MADLRKIIGQTFIIGISGTSLTNEEKRFITSNNIGGVILFSRNIESPKQLHSLCAEIQSLHHQSSDKAPLFISIDMEGGRVARLKAPYTQWPPMKNLGDMDSPSLAFKFAQAMGDELYSTGINLNFSPCVDVLTNPKNELIGDRSFGTDPDLVGRLSSALVRGFLKANIIACAKHFPGHGNTIIDSHFDLPIEEVSLEELRSRELQAFKKAFRARVDLVMTAHILYKNIDPDNPATLSKKILSELVEETGYKKLIITDDLDMHALTKYHDKESLPVKAIEAGAHIMLYCNDPESHKIGLDAVEKAVKDGVLDLKTIEKNRDMTVKLKKSRIKNFDLIEFEDAAKRIGHPDHLQLAKAIADKELPADIST
ncbi:MAG: beta-N-acetylhexosaminidase [Bdellovibrionota bacterium]|nr:beta-N-acetylhexosaminidase [Pseudobdellovibrionaceae bacterium]|tara:strand:- start:47047 stop:48156 length:1110 start_codon:yes stop_codon:yes gene_type:complete